MTVGDSKQAFVRRLVLADILARPGDGPLAPRFTALFPIFQRRLQPLVREPSSGEPEPVR